MTPISIDQYSERQQRAANRILEQLERTQSRTDSQYARTRKHERKHFRCLISVFIPTAEQREAPLDLQGTFTAWSYSLSQGGVGFIAPVEVSCQEVLIGVHLASGQIRWMSGRVVRQRAVPEEEFLDYGIAFHAAHRERQPEEAAMAQ